MIKFWTRVLSLAVMVPLLLPAVVLAGKNAPLVVVAHTTKLKGVNSWWANLYNDDMVMFNVLTIAFISTFGTLLGLGADLIMSRSGLDLKSRELKEH